MQVSVIVLTYNPDNQKLKQTVAAIAAQQDISFELIISDDGSARKDFSFLPEYIASLGIKNWRLLEHAQNRGTVQSCLSAVEAAEGEYVFLTSPGDFLYDDTVLRDFYAFATTNNAPLCFGNAVFYAPGEGRQSRTLASPKQPALYAPQAPLSQVKAGFFGGCWAIGASYFRKRMLALDTLRAIGDTAVYMEDTPSTAVALANGERLVYFDRHMVWYEDGTGVSTSANQRWVGLLQQDLQRSLDKLKASCPTDGYVDVLWRNVSQPNRMKRLVGNLWRHPVIMWRIYRCRSMKPKTVCCTPKDLNRLSRLLSMT